MMWRQPSEIGFSPEDPSETIQLERRYCYKLIDDFFLAVYIFILYLRKEVFQT